MIWTLPQRDRAGWVLTSVLIAVYGVTRIVLGVSFYPLSVQEDFPTALSHVGPAWLWAWSWIVCGLLLIAAAAALFRPAIRNVAFAVTVSLNCVWAVIYLYGYFRLNPNTYKDLKEAAAYIGMACMFAALTWMIARYKPAVLRWRKP